jgi:hypothetical protein
MAHGKKSAELMEQKSRPGYPWRLERKMAAISGGHRAKAVHRDEGARFARRYPSLAGLAATYSSKP